MHVTFSLAVQDSDVVGWNLVCTAEGRLNERPLGYQESNLLAVTHRAACEDDICQAQGPDREVAYAHPDLGVRLEVDGPDAVALLGALGPAGEQRPGSMDAAAVSGAVLLALAAHEGDGTPSPEGADEGGPDLRARLAALLDVAGAATRQGRDVVWA